MNYGSSEVVYIGRYYPSKGESEGYTVKCKEKDFPISNYPLEQTEFFYAQKQARDKLADKKNKVFDYSMFHHRNDKNTILKNSGSSNRDPRKTQQLVHLIISTRFYSSPSSTDLRNLTPHRPDLNLVN